MELKLFGEKLQKEVNALQKGTDQKVEDRIEAGARKLSRQLSDRYILNVAIEHDYVCKCKQKLQHDIASYFSTAVTEISRRWRQKTQEAVSVD